MAQNDTPSRNYQIVILHAAGQEVSVIAERFGISKRSVWRILQHPKAREIAAAVREIAFLEGESLLAGLVRTCVKVLEQELDGSGLSSFQRVQSAKMGLELASKYRSEGDIAYQLAQIQAKLAELSGDALGGGEATRPS